MADEPNAFEPWGGEEDASKTRSRPSLRLPRPSMRLSGLLPTGRLMPALLITLIVGASSVVGAELTRSGPFAPASALTATPVAATPAQRASGELPRGELRWRLLATGTDETTGEVNVRAWDLSRVCNAAACHLELTREVFTRTARHGTIDRAALTLRTSSATGSLYRARFAPLATTCWYQSDGAWHSAGASQTDSLALDWTAATRRLTAAETSTTTGCPGRAATDSQRWTLARVRAGGGLHLAPERRAAEHHRPTGSGDA